MVAVATKKRNAGNSLVDSSGSSGKGGVDSNHLPVASADKRVTETAADRRNYLRRMAGWPVKGN